MKTLIKTFGLASALSLSATVSAFAATGGASDILEPEKTTVACLFCCKNSCNGSTQMAEMVGSDPETLINRPAPPAIMNVAGGYSRNDYRIRIR